MARINSSVPNVGRGIEHYEDCPFNRAMGQSIECEHGYDVCPKCDPCTCDTTHKAYERAMEIV